MPNTYCVRDAVPEFLAYAGTKTYEFNYFSQMKVFMEYLAEEAGECRLNSKKDCEDVRIAAVAILKGTKKEYPKLKATKVDRGKFFNSFVDYLMNYKRSRSKLEKIPFVMNDLERKLDLVKHYREYYVTDRLPAQEIAARYYVDEKTIRNDKRDIKEGSLNAFGQKIDIEYDYDKKSFYSTPVPIFTVQNITQIVTVLSGLGEMYQKKEYKKYALTTAITIWQQLTATVQKRILEDLVSMLKLDEAWYQLISKETNESSRGFYPEYCMDDECSLLRFFKNSETVDLCYAEGDEVKEIKNVKIKDYAEGAVIVTGDVKIPTENIIKITESGISF